MAAQQIGLLRQQLIGLAGTPDDSAQVAAELADITRLAAARIAAVDHASVTSRYEGVHATVAASSDRARAIDEAQYRDDAGPCLEALEASYPAAVPDIAATMTWPGFRDVAAGFGVRASLSLPLVAGSGRTVAALNLYSRDPGAMAPLSAAVWAAYDPDWPEPWKHDDLEPGGRELVGGLVVALALRTLIQRAIGILMSTTARTADLAYLALRTRAAESGASLADAAAQVIEQQQTRVPSRTVTAGRPAGRGRPGRR
jgi:hypothetical protein